MSKKSKNNKNITTVVSREGLLDELRHAGLDGQASSDQYNYSTQRPRGLAVMSLGTRSSHKAPVVFHGHKTYAIGMAMDTREGYHSPLALEDWYEVVRNNEVEQASGTVAFD